VGPVTAVAVTREERSFMLTQTIHDFVSTLVRSGHTSAEVWDTFAAVFTPQGQPVTFTRKMPMFTGTISRTAVAAAIPCHFEHGVCEEEVEEGLAADGVTNANIVDQVVENDEVLDVTPATLDSAAAPTDTALDSAADGALLATTLGEAVVTTEAVRAESVDVKQENVVVTTSTTTADTILGEATDGKVSEVMSATNSEVSSASVNSHDFELLNTKLDKILVHLGMGITNSPPLQLQDETLERLEAPPPLSCSSGVVVEVGA